MHRREFIKSAAITVAGLSMPHGINTLLNAAEAAEKTDLAVTHGVSPAKITRAAIDVMGGMDLGRRRVITSIS